MDTRKLYEVIVYIERTKQPNDIINLKILRDNNEIVIPLTLGERPPY
jgi:hypothetical protein